MEYTIKPVVRDYGVICIDTGKVMCICNIKRNAELIADILNWDDDVYAYPIVKAERKV